MPPRYSAIKPMFQSNRWRIFPGDKVMRWHPKGSEERQAGTVLQVIRDRKTPLVVVEGWNMRKKKIMTGEEEDDFFVVSMEAPLPYSSVGVVDPNSQKPVRIKFRYTEGGERLRVGRGRGSTSTPHSEVIIPIPKQEDDGASTGLTGDKDTPAEEASLATYDPTASFPFRPRLLGDERLAAPSAAGLPAGGTAHLLGSSSLGQKQSPSSQPQQPPLAAHMHSAARCQGQAMRAWAAWAGFAARGVPSVTGGCSRRR